MKVSYKYTRTLEELKEDTRDRIQGLKDHLLRLREDSAAAFIIRIRLEENENFIELLDSIVEEENKEEISFTEGLEKIPEWQTEINIRRMKEIK